MRDACQFTRIRPASGRSVGVFDTPLHRYGMDTRIFETSRTGYGMDTRRFTRIRPASGRLVGLFDTPLHGYMNDSCIDDRPRTGYGIDTYMFTAFASYQMRLEGVFFCALHGHMKNLCRSAGNVFTPRKSPGPFASKESGLGFLLCESAYRPYLSQNDSGNHVFIQYVSKNVPRTLAEPIFSGGYASRKSSCLRSKLACSTVIVIGSPKR